MKISISVGNMKMGAIPSVSLPAYLTCRQNSPCYKLCYAAKIAKLRKTVNDSYQRNYEVLKNSPEVYWREVEGAIMMTRFFRYHVSGDIVDIDYLNHMIEIAKRNPHCEQLCFTKKYEIVNDVLSENISLPSNLHIIYSAWDGLKMDNPYSLPEAHIEYKDGHRTTQDDCVVCTGNCSECAKTNGGCWSLKSGQKILLKQH